MKLEARFCTTVQKRLARWLYLGSDGQIGVRRLGKPCAVRRV